MTEQQLEVIKATVQALVNDQAFLYALIQKLDTRLGEPLPDDLGIVNDQIFEQWQDEWKRETAHNIRVLLGETDEDDQDTAGGPLTR